ncbi:MAG: thioredoxin family protein, partial [Pseudomonadota bacterium]
MRILPWLSFLLILSAQATIKKEALPSGIDWHTATVEEAFAKAAKINTPLFLYWGALWCPPCNQIKKVIFSSAIFKKEIPNFVAVYLDGDEPQAQE